MGHRKISETIRNEAVQLVVAQGYSVPQAGQATGVGATALRRWVAQWRVAQEERSRTDASPGSDSARIKELEAALVRMGKALAQAEEERDTLKKSTAFFVRTMRRSGK